MTPAALALLLAAPYLDLVHLYDYDRAARLELREAGMETRDGLEVHDISYASPKGGRVAAYLVVPPGRGPFAGILFMHGAGGSRGGMLAQTIQYAKAGAVCLAIDAAMSGSRAMPGEQFLDYRRPERTRDAFIQTVIDSRRAVDVLLARPDVDPSRLAFVGGRASCAEHSRELVKKCRRLRSQFIQFSIYKGPVVAPFPPRRSIWEGPI